MFPNLRLRHFTENQNSIVIKLCNKTALFRVKKCTFTIRTSCKSTYEYERTCSLNLREYHYHWINLYFPRSKSVKLSRTFVPRRKRSTDDLCSFVEHRRYCQNRNLQLRWYFASSRSRLRITFASCLTCHPSPRRSVIERIKSLLHILRSLCHHRV